MLPPDLESREKGYEIIHQVLRARSELSADENDRMKEIARLFGLEGGAGQKPPARNWKETTGQSLLSHGRGSGHASLRQTIFNALVGRDRAEVLLGAYSLKTFEDVVTQFCENDGRALPFKRARQDT